MKNAAPVQHGNRKRLSWASVFALAALLGSESLADGLIVTNEIIGTKFAEQMSRKIKFVHAGPIVGHWAEITDKGAFTLQAQLVLDGVDVTQFTSNALFGILVQLSEEGVPDPNDFLTFHLRDDPKYVNGDTKAVFLKTETVNVFIYIEEAGAGQAVVGSKAIQLTGAVQSEEVSDPEIGTYSNSKVSIAGP